MSKQLRDHLAELFKDAPKVSDEQRKAWQAEADQIAMLEPSVVTHCHTCGQTHFMARMGCANRECPDQPMAINVSHYYENHIGQLLRPGIDWVPLEQRPLTEWT